MLDLVSVSVPRSVSALQPWVAARVFGAAEVHAAAVIVGDAADTDPLVQLGAAFALRAPLHSDVCLDLASARSTVETQVGQRVDDAFAGHLLDELRLLPWPDLEPWVGALRASPLVRTVERAESSPPLDQFPLVLCGSRLYTQRQWIDECTVASRLLAFAGANPPADISSAALDLLQQLLPAEEDHQPNAQHHAALAALRSHLAVVVGGPGTGKTHTVARLLAVLLSDAATQSTPIRIALAAPTGKAATRARDALAAAAAALPAALGTALCSIPAVTVHRLLGPRGGNRSRFVHNADNPLPYDVIVIDETSMVAMPLMARLVEAVPDRARLILVGDPDQLESIEVGSVLSDIVDASTDPGSPIREHVVRLSRPRRQDAASPIGPLADAIRENRADDVLTMLHSDANPLLSFIVSEDPLATANGAGVRELVVPALTEVVAAASAGDGAGALAGLARLRILCAHRHGSHGAEAWNAQVESWLLGNRPRGRFYPGRALLATRNDLRQRIANGDTGVVVADDTGIRAAFAVGDGVRLLAPAQLEGVETSFATTIHKSQGSEYELVVVVLAPASSPILRRELLYTAVTRTTSRLVVVGSEAAVIAAVHMPSRRVTGLTEALAPAGIS